MKHVFVSFVMICSLLLATCDSSNDFTIQQEPELKVPEKPVINQKEPVKNKTDSSNEEEPDESDSEDIDQEDEEEDEDEIDIDYQDNDQEQTNDNELDFMEIVPLEFVDFNLYSKKEIRFNFTTAVNNVFCTFTPHQEIERVQDGKTVKIYLKENLELQTEFLIELNVKDNWDNSLSVEVPLFVNDWVPKIEINELRTKHDSSKKRAEFIEFKVKSAGDLNGLQIYIMWNSKKQYVFDLKPVDVKSGEYVVFHLRTLEDTCVDELGEDLSESIGIDSSPNARDLWVPGSEEWLHETDIVYLQDANGRILDAIVMNAAPAETWNKNQSHFTKIVEDLYNKGVWKSADGNLPGPLDAVDTSKTSATKTICRYEGKENTHTAKDWYITDLNKASPGMPNK